MTTTTEVTWTSDEMMTVTSVGFGTGAGDRDRDRDRERLRLRGPVRLGSSPTSACLSPIP